MFRSIAEHDDGNVSAALLFPNAHNRDLSVLSSHGKAYDLDHVTFEFKPVGKEPLAGECMSPEVAKKLGARIGEEKFKKQSLREFLTPKTELKVDDASVILVSRENRSIVGKKGNYTVLRLPKITPFAAVNSSIRL